MACGNNMVSRSGLQTQPTPPAQPTVVVDLGRQRQAETNARQASGQINQARRAVQDAMSVNQIRTALQSAQAALDAARRAARDPASRARLRDLERGVEQLRRDATDKERELDTAGRRRDALSDRLGRLSLGARPSDLAQAARLGRVAVNSQMQMEPGPTFLGQSIAELDLAELPLAGMQLVQASASSTYEVRVLTPGDGTEPDSEHFAYFKPADGYQRTDDNEMGRTSVPLGGEWKREVAAYRVDKALGLGIVPTTVGRVVEFDGASPGSRARHDPANPKRLTGSLQAEAPGDPKPREQYDESDRARMAVLDYVLANMDRHRNNYRTFASGRLAATDHGYSLPLNASEPIRSSFVTDFLGRPLPAELLMQLRGVPMEKVRAEFAALGIEQAATSGALARLEEVVRDGYISGSAWPGSIKNENYVTYQE